MFRQDISNKNDGENIELVIHEEKLPLLTPGASDPSSTPLSTEPKSSTPSSSQHGMFSSQLNTNPGSNSVEIKFSSETLDQLNLFMRMQRDDTYNAIRVEGSYHREQLFQAGSNASCVGGMISLLSNASPLLTGIFYAIGCSLCMAQCLTHCETRSLRRHSRQ